MSLTKPQDELLLRYLDGALEPDDITALQTLLETHPEANERLLLHARVLEQLGGPARLAISEQSSTGPQASTPEKASPRSITSWLPWAIAAAACLIAAFTIFGKRASAPAVGPEALAQKSVGAALLVNEASAVFAEGAAPDGFRFEPGTYTLQGGTAHLRFACGADFVASAPATFHIEDSLHLELDQGDVRVFAPPSAHGFTVSHGPLELVDYGTEFGVSIHPETSQQTLHVFAGRVDAKRRGDKTVLASVKGGEVALFESGELVHQLEDEKQAPDNAAFPSIEDIGLFRWRAEQQRIIDDPALRLHMAFDETVEPAQPQNAKSEKNTNSPSRLVGAREVSGRWPGKRALLFDGRDDYLEVDLGKNHRELSLAIWIRPDGFDNALNAILDTNGWRDGGLHLQVDRSGRPWFGLFDPEVQIKPADTLLQIGRWHHVALTLSTIDGDAILYVDGAEAARGTIFTPDMRLSPGKARLANWAWDGVWEQDPRRHLRAVVDEFSVWSRALTAADISELHEVGRPNLLPPSIPVLSPTPRHF